MVNILGGDKLRQMLSASLEAYHSGSDTHQAREQIVLDYLNTMPLAAVPRVAKSTVLGDGLRVWFAMDLPEVRTALEQAEPTPERHAPTDMLSRCSTPCMHRTPIWYIAVAHSNPHRCVSSLLSSAASLMYNSSRSCIHAPLEFADLEPFDRSPPFVERKAVNAAAASNSRSCWRYRVSMIWTDCKFRWTATNRGALQDGVTQLLRRLASLEFVAASGLRELECWRGAIRAR